MSLLKKSQQNIQNGKSDTYQIKVFIQFMKHSPFFTGTISLLRGELINKTIGEKNYHIIKKKMHYYYYIKDKENNNNNDYNDYNEDDSESCLTRFYDRYILHRPSYYYADYTLLHPKDKDIEDIVYMIRQKYGYSQRSHSSLLPINLSERSYIITSPTTTTTTTTVGNNNNNTLILRNSRNENNISLLNHTTNYYNLHKKNSSIVLTSKKIICNPPSCTSFPIDINSCSYTSIRNGSNCAIGIGNGVKTPLNSLPFENDT